jgi:protein-tyrosine phosphatase
LIDIHCHILPGLDDGPETIEESLAMCRIASEDGITAIVATPHFKPGVYSAISQEVFEKTAQLQEAADREGLKVRIVPGADVAVTPELPGHLRSIGHLSINRAMRYFLAELPPDSVPPRWEDFLLSIRRSGIVPILTHPERNPWFLRHSDALYQYVRSGGMVQLTGMSLTEGSPEEVKAYCLFLLKNNLAHVIASDGHSPVERRPVLSAARAVAESVLGKEHARRLVVDNPLAIIEGRPVQLAEPLVDIPGKRTWLQRLAGAWDR